MRRRPKPPKRKVQGNQPRAGKSPKTDDTRVRVLEKRLAEAQRREAEALKRESEALEQQTAADEILRVISRSPNDLAPVFGTILDNALRLCEAHLGFLFLYDGDAFEMAADRGAPPSVEELYRRFRAGSTTGLGRVLAERRPVHIPDIRDEEAYRRGDPLRVATADLLGARTFLAVPLLKEIAIPGAIVVYRREVRPFSEAQVALLQTFADQAVIAIENVRLFNETREALEQQTATAEILRVISGSQSDVQPVFDTIVRSAVRLCDASASAVLRCVGETLHLVANHGLNPQWLEAARQLYPQPIEPDRLSSLAILERRIIHVPDLEADERYPQARALARAGGYRSLLFVPMLHESVPIGAITAAKNDPFSDSQIALLQTFADQAVIAIENVRLFTELQERNGEVEQKSRELAAASQHKSEFLANMSHELRTPLNAVLGFSEVLLQRMFGELNGKQDEYLKDIYASGQHLLSLINDILDLSKIEAGRMELVPAPFHLPSAVENAVTLVRERAARHGIALHLDLDPGLGELVGDERKIKQLLLNLLSNAVKFTPEGGRISLKASRTDGTVEITVTDTGIGIAPEDQAAIFEEFRQVGSDETRKQEGTGLGLTLAKKFIELHGGRIWVESELGRGSTFTLTLPVS